MSRSKLLNPARLSFWFLITFITGIVLRSIHYFGRSSMWFDELTNALNIQSRSFYQLTTESLDYNQVAPVGFLLLSKLATVIFGENDHAYRFFSWVWSIAGLFLFYDISKRFLKGGFWLTAFILFATSYSQIFYGGEAKQYAGDVTACMFLVWGCLKLINETVTGKSFWLIAVVGVVAILCSLPATPLACTLILITIVLRFKRQLRPQGKSAFILSVIWGIGVILSICYVKFVISNTVKDAMTDYWSRGFPSTNSFLAFVSWFPEKLAEQLNFFIYTWMYYAIPQVYYIVWILLALALPGTISLFKQKFSNALILFSPLIVALLLASARILPFDNRVGIYGIWPLLIVSISGLQALHEWIPRIVKPVTGTIIGLALALPMLIIIAVFDEWPPYHGQSSQPVLRDLKRKLQPGDQIYVYYKARHAMRFYGSKEGITEFHTGHYYDSIVPYLREIDSFRGKKRVWFFYSQWTEKQPFPDNIKAYMGTVIGHQVDKIPDPYGGKEDMEAAAYLYDLSGN